MDGIPSHFSGILGYLRAVAGSHSPLAHDTPATAARCSRTYSTQPRLLQGAVNGNHVSVSKFDLNTGSVDIERTGNNLLTHNRVLLNLFLFSWTSGL